MEKRILGRTGLEVSRIGFGAIPIMDKPEDFSIRLVQKAIDAGINYLDTARGYGDTEEKIGKAIKGRRDEVIIATKTPKRSYLEAKANIERSLRLLQMDTIDILQLHGVDDVETLNQVLGEQGAYRALLEARQEGKARFIGITGHNPSILTAAINRESFDLVLAKFSITDREADEVLFPSANDKGLGIAIMKSLDGGLMGIPGEAGRLEIGGESMSVAQGAVAFALSNRYAATVVVGLGSKKQLAEMVELENRKQSMDDGFAEKVATLAETIGKGFCLQCGYCKPYCPEGIDIPFVFKAQIYSEKFGMKRCTMWTPESIKQIVDKCTACGECLVGCPEKLTIPDRLRKSAEVFSQ
ncbi:MAG: aldo/keto reductase [Armatimonadetes bacterium]|nr:aldo/keto reductase [Armatimonadota bacterium]